jgi:hypothetical protein
MSWILNKKAQTEVLCFFMRITNILIGVISMIGGKNYVDSPLYLSFNNGRSTLESTYTFPGDGQFPENKRYLF